MFLEILLVLGLLVFCVIIARAIQSRLCNHNEIFIFIITVLVYTW